MKKINKITSAFFIALVFLAAGCSDEFLAEKRPYGSFGPDQVYGDWSSVKLRLNYIYQKSLPYFKGASLTTYNFPPDLWPIGLPDLLSSNTDEFTGYGDYVNPINIWTNTNIHKYFYYGINESPWKKMRECTDVIVGVNETQNSNLTDQQKHEVEGQARFFRATRYFRLFKRFGGVPIVRGLQSTLMGDRDSLAISRQSTDDTYHFIINDLMYGGKNLPAKWDEVANDWGRITSGTCYALAGIVANYYASPVFNRADDVARWDSAYAINKKALEVLSTGGFGLAYENNPGTNASNWAKIWCNVMASDGQVSEGVYMAMCNNVEGENDLYNCWEQSVRPGNANGGGGVIPSAEMVDAFPMADGKRPEQSGLYSYDKRLFFLNRDPRFYRTFAFPGEQWKFNGVISADLATQCPYQSGSDYQLMNFAWYSDADAANNTVQSGYFTDLMGSKGQTVYVRKKSQDAALGEKALYNFQNDGGFKMNGQPLLAIRYTEVLLNFAEAACGINHLDEAWDALIRIRKRVGYTGDCGLDPAIKSDRAKMFEAILYERQIELAYEGKRFDDCHRWMLFDGGVGQEELKSDWKLTGWNGNTCDYLGVTPLNQVLRHRIELYFDPAVYIGEKKPEADPFLVLGLSKPKALTLNENITATTTEGLDGSISVTYNNSTVKALGDFYRTNLLRKDVETMTSIAVTGVNPIWDKKLYLMGLASGDQENNPGVVQTIGWNSRFGGLGIFDPLSKNPKTSINDEESVTQ